MTRALGLLAVILAATAGCVSTVAPTPGSGGIRTFAVLHAVAGQPILCTAEAAVRPVVGTFHGDPAAPGDKAWLVDPNGRKLVVLWPEGFSLRFDPSARLFNEKGQVVASEGDRVEIGQVNLEAHAGTDADPYLARGILFDGCYNAADGRR